MFGTIHFLMDRQASFQDRFRCGELAVLHIGVTQAAEHHRRNRTVRSKPALCLGQHPLGEFRSLRIFAVLSEFAHLAVEKNDLVRFVTLCGDGHPIRRQQDQRQQGYRHSFRGDRMLSGRHRGHSHQTWHSCTLAQSTVRLGARFQLNCKSARKGAAFRLKPARSSARLCHDTCHVGSCWPSSRGGSLVKLWYYYIIADNFVAERLTVRSAPATEFWPPRGDRSAQRL